MKIAEDSLFTNSYNLGKTTSFTPESSTKVGNTSYELSHIQLERPAEINNNLETIPEMKETFQEDPSSQYEQTQDA